MLTSICYKYLEENPAATKIQLATADLEEVRVVAQAADATQGEGYPPEMTRALFADSPEIG